MPHALVKTAEEMEAWLLGIGNIALGSLYSQYCDSKHNDVFAQSVLTRSMLSRTLSTLARESGQLTVYIDALEILCRPVKAPMSHLAIKCYR